MENKNLEFAGFWKRFAAMLIDGAVIIFFCSSTKWVIAESLRLEDEFGVSFEESHDIAYVVWSIYLIFIRWCYFAGMESSPLKATIGKMAVGIYVTNDEGERANFGQTSGRFFGKIISGLILCVGYIIAAFTNKKQALHDLMSNCLVLTK